MSSPGFRVVAASLVTPEGPAEEARGPLVDELSLGCGHATYGTFVGPDFKTLYVTEDEAGQIVACGRGVAGLVFYSRSRPRCAPKRRAQDEGAPSR